MSDDCSLQKTDRGKLDNHGVEYVLSNLPDRNNVRGRGIDVDSEGAGQSIITLCAHTATGIVRTYRRIAEREHQLQSTIANGRRN